MNKLNVSNGAIRPKTDFENAAQQTASKPKRKIPPPVSFRVYDQERAALKRAAAGMSLSDHIRQCLFVDGNGKSTVPNRSAIKDDAAIAQVLGLLGRSRIANNLNQLARLGHCGALPMEQETLEKLDEAHAHVTSMRSILIRALGLMDGGKK